MSICALRTPSNVCKRRKPLTDCLDPMNVLMLTNTYLPHVGGVARSVSGLAQGLLDRGHDVRVVAPEFPGSPEVENKVIRITALQRFAGSDFSMPLPLTWPLSDAIEDFAPDIVHAHHPFLLGDTALRVAAGYQLPIIFTYHTRYELYGHYVAQDSEWLKRLVLSLAHGYCDLCDHVIAPSQSIARHLTDNGVAAPITVVPTGIDVAAFATGQRERGRARWNLPSDAFVAGHVGRLAPEKNLGYLTNALILFLHQHTKAHVLVTGDGASRTMMQDAFASAGFEHRVRFTGVLTGDALHDAYACQDVFVFSSRSETQGLVLVEAMATGSPVLALNAPGVREVVRDGVNGRLLSKNADGATFAEALHGLASLNRHDWAHLCEAARRTACDFSTERCLDRTLDLYQTVSDSGSMHKQSEQSTWEYARRRLEREVDIVSNIARAVGDAVLLSDDGEMDRPLP